MYLSLVFDFVFLWSGLVSVWLTYECFGLLIVSLYLAAGLWFEITVLLLGFSVEMFVDCVV